MQEKNNEDKDQEIIDIVKNDLGEEITTHDVDRTHGLGKRKLDNNVTRPIVVKFTRYNVRNRIFKTNKKLKGKTVSITESLTKRRVVELKKVREMYGFKNVWSQDGKILFSGRILLDEATIDDTVFVLINIYNVNTESEQLETLLDLVSIIDKVKDIQSKNIVLGGDFNVIFDISLESLGGNPCLKKKSIAKLIQIKEKFDLCDIWRIRNPKIKRFTF